MEEMWLWSVFHLVSSWFRKNIISLFIFRLLHQNDIVPWIQTTIKFVFPRITSLYLESLPELKYFYPGKHTLEWPSLKRLRIKNCDKVKMIASNELSFQERDELGHHVQIQQPLFPIEKVWICTCLFVNMYMTLASVIIIK